MFGIDLSSTVDAFLLDCASLPHPQERVPVTQRMSCTVGSRKFGNSDLHIAADDHHLGRFSDVVEGIVDHHILGVHHVVERLNLSVYDCVFLLAPARC
jgi:hypothetical protein